MADLLMIVPTRGRPQNIAALLQSWADTATGAADLAIVLDEDDPLRPEYETHLDNDLLAAIAGQVQFVLMHERLRLVGTLNQVATSYAAGYRMVGFMGDDHRPRSHGWDARFVECLSAGAGIAYGNDLLQGEAMPTAVAMTSDIVTTLGYMAPPSFVHLCVDLVWKDWGQGIGRITYMPDLVIEHMHPANGKAPMDEGYADANSSERATGDAAAYHQYREQQLADDLAKLKELL